LAFGVLETTAKDGITLIGSFAGDNDARRIVFGAFGVLVAFYGRGTFIGTGAIDTDTLFLIIAFHMCIWTASLNGIAFVGTRERKKNASGKIFCALRMFPTPDCGRTLVGTRIDVGHTLITIADEMLFDVAAVRIPLAIIGTGAGNSDAEICTA